MQHSLQQFRFILVAGQATMTYYAQALDSESRSEYSRTCAAVPELSALDVYNFFVIIWLAVARPRDVIGMVEGFFHTFL